jgi:hypothetical protein
MNPAAYHCAGADSLWRDCFVSMLFFLLASTGMASRRHIVARSPLSDHEDRPVPLESRADTIIPYLHTFQLLIPVLAQSASTNLKALLPSHLRFTFPLCHNIPRTPLRYRAGSICPPRRFLIGHPRIRPHPVLHLLAAIPILARAATPQDIFHHTQHLSKECPHSSLKAQHLFLHRM